MFINVHFNMFHRRSAPTMAMSLAMAILAVGSGQQMLWEDLGHSPNSGYWQSVALSRDGTTMAVGGTSSPIYISTNLGTSWIDSGSSFSGNTNALALSDDGSTILAGAYPGFLWISTNGGSSFNQDTSVGSTKQWTGTGIAGTKMVAIASFLNIRMSTNSGASFAQTNVGNELDWYDIAISSDGMKLITVVYGGNIWTSTDGASIVEMMRSCHDCTIT